MNLLKLNKSVILDIDKQVVDNTIILEKDKRDILMPLKDKKNIKIKHKIINGVITTDGFEAFKGLNAVDIKYIFGFRYNIKLTKIEDFMTIEDEIIGDKFLIIDNVLFFNNENLITKDDLYVNSVITGNDMEELLKLYKDKIDKTTEIINKYDIRIYDIKLKKEYLSEEDRLLNEIPF